MNRIVTMVLKNLPIVPGAWQKLCRYAKHPEKYSEEEMYRHIQYILKRAVRGGNIDLQVSGTENIPKEGGFMLYANHQGMFDVLAVAATCDIPVGAVLKKELYDIPFLHQVAICTRSFPMDREDVRQSLTVIQSVIREVKAGRNYLIFPEGTRSRNGNQMGQFHSCKVLDQKGSKPVTGQIHYLKPICWEEYGNLKTTELAALVKERIAQAIEAHTVKES